MKNLNYEEVENIVKRLAIQVSLSDVNINEISSSSNILTDLNFNSYLFIELIVDLEDELQINFDDEDLVIDKFEKLSNFINLLLNKYLCESYT